MCKNRENGAKWPIFRKSARLRNGLRAIALCAHACTLAHFGTGQSHAGLGA